MSAYETIMVFLGILGLLMSFGGLIIALLSPLRFGRFIADVPWTSFTLSR